MAKSKTRAELETENRLLRKSAVLGAFAAVAQRALTVFGFVVVAYFVNDSIHALAAKKTLADIGVRFLADVRFSEAVAWVFGVGGVGFGYSQRRLRIRTATRQGKRLRELETRLHPDRSSSRMEE